jgi:hypothetical protein
MRTTDDGWVCMMCGYWYSSRQEGDGRGRCGDVSYWRGPGIPVPCPGRLVPASEYVPLAADK